MTHEIAKYRNFRPYEEHKKKENTVLNCTVLRCMYIFVAGSIFCSQANATVLVPCYSTSGRITCHNKHHHHFQLLGSQPLLPRKLRCNWAEHSSQKIVCTIVAAEILCPFARRALNLPIQLIQYQNENTFRSSGGFVGHVLYERLNFLCSQ
jgi:hypothetical protein